MEIFCSYAHADQSFVMQLKSHLTPLLRFHSHSLWSDINISPGSEWEGEIQYHLETAHIILLLISPDFMNSEYGYGKEMVRALERHEQGDAHVIPIIVRPVYWKAAPFGTLQALPTGGRPITDRGWHTLDDAFLDITEGIRQVIESMAPLSVTKHLPDSKISSSYSFSEPMKSSGVSDYIEARSIHSLSDEAPPGLSTDQYNSNVTSLPILLSQQSQQAAQRSTLKKHAILATGQREEAGLQSQSSWHLRGSLVQWVVLIAGLGLLLFLSSGIIYDVAFLRPNILRTQATAQAGETATAFANTPGGLYERSTQGQPEIDDPLSDNSQGNQWDENAGCRFAAGTYHASMYPQSGIGAIGCFALGIRNLRNFVYQAQMTITKGDGGGGLLLRTGTNPDGTISSTSFGYQWQLNQANFRFWSFSPIFHGSTITAKLNQAYLLTVIAKGSTFSLYIDKQWMGTVEDSNVSSGSVGLVVYAQTQLTEVTYRNVQIWNL